MGIQLLLYGLVKLAFGQFGIPAADIASSHGEGFVLAWKFFGYSRVYEIFIGIGEVLAGLLIMIPRTFTLGAVIYFPIALNIMMVNYCYRIGVQDLSTMLVLMNVYLLWLDRKKLLMIFWKTDSSDVSPKNMEMKGERIS
ncbi:hypothetical protein [Polycladomyces subterraneus]|uniref:DoxX family protein n=1 Tax=Polycladomyces subterraneus TaxID=1016997 RepID=A0ABT8IQD6_9BACL|nr:hypothetical protein [Polycladomyces subterraneus]MDN4594999.1 hypothetical protein [Polycladomyces subterraneus]